MIQNTETATAHPPGRKHSMKQYFLGIVILLCGMVIGAGLMSFVLWNSLQKPMRLYDRMPDRIVEDMKTHIDLTEEQAEQIQEVFRRHLAVFDSVRQEVEPKINNEISLMENEIRDILTKEQQERWEDRYMKFRRRWFPGPPRMHSHHGDRRPPFDDKSPPWDDRRQRHSDPFHDTPSDSAPPKPPDHRPPGE